MDVATSLCTAAIPSETGSAASCSPAGLSTDVSSHAANSWRCHHDKRRHLLCHFLCRGAVQGLARARVEQVVLEPHCVQPRSVITHERPLAVQAAVLHSCLAILLRLLPLKLCLFPAALNLPATPPPLPTHYQACGRRCLQQLARLGQARPTLGHTTLLA